MNIKYEDIYRDYFIKLSDENPDNLFQHQLTLIKSLLQVTSISALTLIEQLDNDFFIENRFYKFIERLNKPSDGLPVEILDRVTPGLRNYFNSNHDFLRGWFEPNTIEIPLSKSFNDWIVFRNSLGHSAVDNAEIKIQTTEVMPRLISALLNTLSVLIPVRLDGNYGITINNTFYNLSCDFFVNDQLHILNSIKLYRTFFRCKFKTIYFDNSVENSFEILTNSIFSKYQNVKFDSYRFTQFIPSNYEEISIFENIPNKLTTNFVGRTKEFRELLEWFLDDDDVACLIYGDGGYGKTTLVLEFLNQLIEGSLPVNSNRLPQIICFYSAKKTKWEDGKIHYLKGSQPIIGDSLRDLVRAIEERLDKDWYNLDFNQLVSKCETILKQNGFKRDDILFIIDNTETLSSNSSENSELQRAFKLISKKIARLIVTSRRRENLSGTPIQISGLTESECISLIERIKKSAESLPNSAINQIGIPGLKTIARDSMYKPIIIESWVKYLMRTSIGLRESFDAMIGKQNTELLLFLYEDAWHRMEDEKVRRAFLLIANIQNDNYAPINEITLPWVCRKCNIQLTNFIDSLEETHFVDFEDNQQKYNLNIVEHAVQFFLIETAKISQEKQIEIQTDCLQVASFYQSQLKIENEYMGDRVSIAFRNRFAKAAKIEFQKKNYLEAKVNYELAIEEDPTNQYLFDRFALFLMQSLKDYHYALEISKKSLELDNQNADALVTYGLINYRLGDITVGDSYIDKSNKMGRSSAFCNIQKGIARYHLAVAYHNEQEVLKSFNSLKQATIFFNFAQSDLCNDTSIYNKKIAWQLNKFKRMSSNLENKLNSIYKN